MVTQRVTRAHFAAPASSYSSDSSSPNALVLLQRNIFIFILSIYISNIDSYKYFALFIKTLLWYWLTSRSENIIYQIKLRENLVDFIRTQFIRKMNPRKNWKSSRIILLLYCWVVLSIYFKFLPDDFSVMSEFVASIYFWKRHSTLPCLMIMLFIAQN